MKTENKKCCFEQYPYPENTIYFFAVGKKKIVYLEDILNNKTKERHLEYVNSLKNIYMVARNIEDAKKELKDNLPEDYIIYSGCTLLELLGLQKDDTHLEHHFVTGILKNNKTIDVSYYRQGLVNDFIKIESYSDSSKNYLCSIGEGILINKNSLKTLIKNMQLVQDGKMFGHYCLSKEEEKEFEELEYEEAGAVSEEKCYQ